MEKEFGDKYIEYKKRTGMFLPLTKMENTRKLFFIKLVHTVVFVFMSVGVFYVFYAGLTKTYNWLLVLPIVAVLIEGIVLLVNGECPLTTLARKYGDEHRRFSDIFLPSWFTPFIAPIFTTLFFVGIVLLGWNYVSGG